MGPWLRYQRLLWILRNNIRCHGIRGVVFQNQNSIFPAHGVSKGTLNCSHQAKSRWTSIASHACAWLCCAWIASGPAKATAQKNYFSDLLSLHFFDFWPLGLLYFLNSCTFFLFFFFSHFFLLSFSPLFLHFSSFSVSPSFPLWCVALFSAFHHTTVFRWKRRQQ